MYEVKWLADHITTNDTTVYEIKHWVWGGGVRGQGVVDGEGVKQARRECYRARPHRSWVCNRVCANWRGPGERSGTEH